ncbi:MAG: acetylornithine transaminase [Peptococcaceae bacterium]|jgi:predicted acetylornithine/succinylornithine family transaminase|nr:acetylornithine transaminase [Peptococcaceae bacterium]
MAEHFTNEEIVARGKQAVMNTYGRLPLALVRGEGSWVWDADEKQYLDFVTGLAVNSLGYSHPAVTAAITQAAHQIVHASNLYWIPNQVRLAEKLTAHSFAAKVFFCNSGAEANEAAIKLARKQAKQNYGEDKYRIVSLSHSFHGRTLAALTATGQTKYQAGYEPLPEGFLYAQLNDIASLEQCVGEQTAAVIIEPIQGEGGVNPASPEFLQAAREVCDRYGALLVFDEVQCGMGRTGKLFAYEWSGVEPDLMTLAKALGGGVPIGALLAAEKAASTFQPGDHASTFGGNPLATAAGNAVIDEMLRPGFLRHVQEMSAVLRAGLDDLAKKYFLDGRVRGEGLILGLPVGDKGPQVVQECQESGLLINCVGGQVLRFLPPLNVSKQEIQLALTLLEQAFLKVIV